MQYYFTTKTQFPYRLINFEPQPFHCHLDHFLEAQLFVLRLLYDKDKYDRPLVSAMCETLNSELIVNSWSF